MHTTTTTNGTTTTTHYGKSDGRVVWAPRGIMAGDMFHDTRATFHVVSATYGYSPAGIPNVSLVLLSTAYGAREVTRTLYTA